MSKMDLDRAQENYERLGFRTAKRVLEFYESKRSQPVLTRPIVSATSANDPTFAASDVLEQSAVLVATR
jgi:hypothetical protein